MKATIQLKDCNIKKLIKQLVVLVDTREQENQHIIDYFDSKGIKWRNKALKTFDYSCELHKNEELGLPFAVSLENEIGIERKAHLTELAGNVTATRTAFEEKWQKAKFMTKDLYLVIEGGSWADIKDGKYRSELNPKSFYNTLISWRHKYGFRIDFVKKENCGEHIIRLLQDKLKKLLQE